MFDKIKTLSDDTRRLATNIFSLSVLQVTNYVLPLLTFPYLVRVLGPEKFGLISFAQAFIQYFVILTEYGFNLSATRDISIFRNDKEKINEIFNSVMAIKCLLLILSFVFLCLVIFNFKKFSDDWLVYFLTFGMVLGNVLFPSWFFQGMEKMKHIVFLNIFSQAIFTASIFIFIKKSSDYIYVPLINSLGFLAAGILALWLIVRNFQVKVYWPDLRSIRLQLEEGRHIFISSVAINAYTVSNTFILGIFTNNVVVGYYSAAEKIVRYVLGLSNPLSQSVFPYMSKLVTTSREQGIRFIRKMIVITGGASLVLSCLIFILANSVIVVLLGRAYGESVVVLRILAFLPFLIGLSGIFGVQIMLPLKYTRAFSSILVAGSLINIVLALLLIPLYQHVGVSVAMVVTEVFVTVAMFLYLKMKGIELLPFRKA